MAWLPSNQEIARHPKTKRLARLLGVSLPTAVGHLHFLWWWALDFAQDGNLSQFDVFDLTSACEWDGDEKKFVKALISAGWIDGNPEDPDGPKSIHDWKEYTGKLIEKREEDAARKRDDREKKKLQKIRSSEKSTDTSPSSIEEPLPSTSISNGNPLSEGEISSSYLKDEKMSSDGVPLDERIITLVCPTDVQRTSINNPELSNVRLTLTLPEHKPIIEDEEDDEARVCQGDLSLAKPGENSVMNVLSSPLPDAALGLKAIAFAETNSQRSLCEYEREKLKEWCEKFAANPDCPDPESIVIAGLERCVTKQDLSNLTAYLDTVLEDFQKNNIINIEQIYNLRKLRNDKAKEKPYSDSKKNRVTQENNYGHSKPEGKYERFYL